MGSNMGKTNLPKLNRKQFGAKLIFKGSAFSIGQPLRKRTLKKILFEY